MMPSPRPLRRLMSRLRPDARRAMLIAADTQLRHAAYRLLLLFQIDLLSLLFDISLLHIRLRRHGSSRCRFASRLRYFRYASPYACWGCRMPFSAFADFHVISPPIFAIWLLPPRTPRCYSLRRDFAMPDWRQCRCCRAPADFQP